MFTKKKGLFLAIGLVLLLAIGLTACEPEQVEVTRVVEQTVEVEVPGAEVQVEVPGPEVEVTRIVEVMVEADSAVSVIPFEELWANSGHNDTEAEAFNHWNEDDPKEVSASCAKCHSTPGYLDFIGADGSEVGSIESPVPVGSTVECAACHNDVTGSMTSVVMPSGVELTGLGDESRCMQCHQGRASKLTVDANIEEAGMTETVDTVSDAIRFTNIHYFAAAATMYGNIAMGGYEYDGKAYDSKFDHVAGYDTCIDCHNPHTLEIEFEECSACHQGLEGSEDLLNVRMAGSLVDYDGNGDTSEGIYNEIEGMRAVLYTAMQAYSTEIAGVGIVYDAASYPYFFDEAGERYASWTARLAKAAYNYQVSLKDPGRFAHGGKYIIQLLYDSTEDLNSALSTPVDMANMNRIDAGHFAGSEEAFRHWDEEGEVPGSCSRCHSAAGLPLFLEQGVTINQPTANGMNCATCHNDLTTFTRYTAEEVTFPSGATVALEDADANLCITCHQGRESGNSVARITDGKDPNALADGLRFINIHYFPAGVSLFGTEVKGAYEYDGQTYVGRNEHVGMKDSCIECHNTHSLEVMVEDCAGCHEGADAPEGLHAIRISEVDYDGDGDVTEGIAGEVETMREAVYAALQAYATATDGVDGLVYDSHAYPYFFNEAGDRYATWTPAMVRAAYNYQYAQKDPGAFAHNGKYVMQILYDATNDLGGDVSGMTRP